MKKILLLSLLLFSSASFANQNSTFANAINTQSEQNRTTQTTDNAQADTANPNNTAKAKDIPANPHDPANGTYLQSIMPNDSELSKANTELLAKNAMLVRQVDDLTTQVNVLVQERSGQLFVYGAMTAVVSVVIGFVLAKLLTRQRW